MKAKVGDLIRTIDGEISGYTDGAYQGQLCIVRQIIPRRKPWGDIYSVTTIATGEGVELYEDEFEVVGDTDIARRSGREGDPNHG